MTGDIHRKPQDEDPRISLAMILKRNLDSSLENWTSESMVQALRSLHTVRLDREDLGAIENLECVAGIVSLYLQQNKIKMINNLDHLSNLRFLTLAGNKIRKLENLSTLQSLKFLDLSDNQIENLDAGELPSNLTILNLSRNLCTNDKGYREMVLKALPDLQELDGEEIKRLGNPDLEVKDDIEGCDYECSDEDLELESPLNPCKGLLMAVHQEILRRSERRRKNAMQEHMARIEEALHLPSPVWTFGHHHHHTEGMDVQINKEVVNHPGMKTENSKDPVASTEGRHEVNPTPKSSKPSTGSTKSVIKRDNPVKDSQYPTAGKITVSQIIKKHSLPAHEKTSLVTDRRILSSPSTGKTSPAQAKAVSESTMSKISVSSSSLNVLGLPNTRKGSPAASGKAVQSPVKKMAALSTQEKVFPTAAKGQRPPSPVILLAKGKSSATPARVQSTKPISVQTVSRESK